MQGMILHPITASGIPWLASWWGHCAFKAAWNSAFCCQHFILYTFKYIIFDKSTSWLQVFGAKYIIAIHLRFVEVIYNAWEQLENQSRTITNMKGKSGQDWNPRCNTKVRKGPWGTEDGVITARRENRTVLLTVYCLAVSPMSSVRHCGEEGRIRALWSTLVPPTISSSLCLRNLTSKEVQRSAVLLTEATTASCLFPSQTRARRQELHHHPAPTRGKTPERRHACILGNGLRIGVKSGTHGRARTFRCPGINNQKYQCEEIFKNHCDVPL